MEVAMEKTIHEFHMWNSMTRRSGKPSEYLIPKYLNALEDARLRSSNKNGDVPEINSTEIWMKMIEMLGKKEYHYDEPLYGDIKELSEKIAYFFHSALQGIEAMPGALVTLVALNNAGLRQAALADAQCFTLVQLTRALRRHGSVPDLNDILPNSTNTLSYEWGIRKPSISLYAQSIYQLKDSGIEPHQVLHVGTRIHDDLAIAKSCGLRTVLFAGDENQLTSHR